MKVSRNWIRANILCHCSYWDGPLSGVAVENGTYYWFECVRESKDYGRDYEAWPFTMTDRIREYLDDYKATYHHTFYVDGKSEWYDGRDLSPLRTKWGDVGLESLIAELNTEGGSDAGQS